MPVFRVEKNSNYTTMCNYHLRDQGLSLKGKGLLSMLLSLPDTWNYSVRGLSSITPDGVDGVLTALKELERLGYLERNQQRESNGRMGRAEYSMFEKSIAMLHNWVMLEAIREDHPKERIVMVILPGAGGELLTEAGSRDIFEDVYDEMEADLVADGELLLHYDKSDVIETDRTRYLLGAAEVSEIDQNGNECSINLFTLERTIDYVNENLTVVSIGGELVPALRLI